MAILGDNTQGGDSFPCADARELLSQFTSVAGGALNAGYAYFDSSSTAGTNAKVILRADSAGAPGALIAASAGAAVPAGGGLINLGAMSGSISASTPYWIGIVADSFSAYLSEDAGGITPDSVMANGTSDYASPPSSWPGTDASYDVRFNAYIDFTESGGAASSLPPRPSRPKGLMLQL